MGEGGQRYKLPVIWHPEGAGYGMVMIANNIALLYLKLAKGMSPKSSSHEKKILTLVWRWMFTKIIVESIPQ